MVIGKAAKLRNEILQSGYFDPTWYHATYLADSNRPTDPLTHFISAGMTQLFNPGPNFDTHFYLESHRDVEAANVEPFLHFIRYGLAEGRIASPRQLASEIDGSGLFDAAWYAKEYRDVGESGLDPLDHYVRLGRLLRRSPGPKFDFRFYCDANPDVADTGTDPLLHFIRTGRNEGRAATAPASKATQCHQPQASKEHHAGRATGSGDSTRSLGQSGWRIATDAFAYRGLEGSAPLAVIANTATAADWHSVLSDLRAGLTGIKADLFLLGEPDWMQDPLPASIQTATYLGAADERGNAKGFVTIAASGALDEYQSLLWISPADERSDGTVQSALSEADSFLADPAWGIGAQAFTVAKAKQIDPALDTALRTALPRIGFELGDADVSLPNGNAIWIKPFLLRGLSPTVRPFEMAAKGGDGKFPGRTTVLAVLAKLAEEARLNPAKFGLAKGRHAAAAEVATKTLKTVAFYLPQFHPIPENDRWWGKGFTEWSNVTRGRQLFRHHDQPRVPTELGYYDLRLEDTQIAQAELARQFGVHGFCYYYYWFNGKKLLNQPIEQMARSSRIDTGFCACWANENWSRNWDGQNRHVLMKQDYDLASNIDLIREMIPMMRDPRWIRFQGKPVMMVYRISIIPNWLETAQAWRDECRRAGIGEIHLCAVRFGLETLSGKPEDHGLDSFVLFPPHEAARKDLRSGVLDLHKSFNGEIFDYRAVVDGDIERFSDGPDWPVHRGAMLGWDNTARRLTDARIFHGATPYSFRRWFSSIIEQELKSGAEGESLIFINAWNEWAEGTYLEPDARWGRGYLAALRSAVETHPQVAVANIARGAASLPKRQTLMERSGVKSSGVSLEVASPIWHEGKRSHNPGHRNILLCAHSAGHQLFGGERSFLDMLDAFNEMDVNVIVTLPSGHNREYLKEILDRSKGAYVLPYPQRRDRRPAQAWITNHFADIIARHGIDVVHVNTIVLLEPLIAARRMNRTSVVHVREVISLDRPLQDQLGMPTEEIIPEVHRLADWVIGNSKVTCALFAKAHRTAYVPNAVEPTDFDLRNLFGKTIKFGIVSSNLPKKGIADFVEVARLSAERSPAARFIVVGPVNDYVKRWIGEIERGERPANIAFVGYRDHPRAAMNESNVLLNLSSFAESFGRTVAEGMAARRPIIAYDWGALPELVQDGETGLLVPYRDVGAVVDAVAEFCDNPDLIGAMGEAGREFIGSHFAKPILNQAMARAYERIVADLSAAEVDHPGAARTTSVIIPVFNAPNDVRNCLTSIVKHTDLNRTRIIVIDDGSSHADVPGILDEFGIIEGVTVVRNPQNRGYTPTVNIGIELAGEHDVVLLNSDTVVSPGWLAGLRSAAYSRPKVATVTAMSDNAGAFSFPHFNQACPKPLHLSHDEYSVAMTQATQHCFPPVVPTGSGFCMFIRRSFIDEHGGFDETGFPRGYGEENDFCMRAVKAGWLNLISPWSFVYHVRSASFGSEKAKLVKEGVDLVTKRYPDYAALVKEAFQGPDMIALREAAAVCID